MADDVRSGELRRRPLPMLFNSFEYFLFLPLVLAAYYLLPLKGRLVMLTGASLFFYTCWNVPYVSLLGLSAVVDYTVARRVEAGEAQRVRKAWLLVSLCVNLGILGFFKYYNFFLDSLDQVGLSPSALTATKMLLPLGISFYTFQTMSYTIDVYRRRIPAERSFLKLLLYVSFFPQLVAGPIVRASDLLPQFEHKHEFDWDNMIEGGKRILSGLIKKVVIADNIAIVVDLAYGSPGEYSGLALVLATWGFALQIFCDFSGYSDIAIGTARMMGFKFMENFDMPYVSRSIQEFWRRWHISLSSWLRDYLYVPLGGNRGGEFKTYRNLMITMLLGGLWHGASFNFIIWGGLHGAWLGVERWITRQRGLPSTVGIVDGRLTSVFKTFLIFNGVCITWVFFRAQTTADSFQVLERIFSAANGLSLPLFVTANALLKAALGCLYFYAIGRVSIRVPVLQWPAAIYGSLVVVLFAASRHEFIYFVF